MNLTKNINFKKFKINKIEKKISKILTNLLIEENQIISSFKDSYNDSWNKKIFEKYKKYKTIILIGMGGSIMGSRSIYSFLKKKIIKNFFFIDSFNHKEIKKMKKKECLNLIISKSGNTLETIVNSNILINKKKKNIFITENKPNYLRSLAYKLKSEVIDHNNYIGGRYSVLSEVGMLPAMLMDLKVDKFRKLNQLIKNKIFFNALIKNVSSILTLTKKNKSNSIILNYDQSSLDLFSWYQQLVAESLGKKSKGILPIISKMPQDNHSLMQFYLDGNKNNFYTFFFVKDEVSERIKNKELLKSHDYLKNRSLENILYNQYVATKNVFSKKKIPFRSFEIYKRDETSLGELFVFFILETILLGKALKINPYDQPSVELIKTETKRNLIS
mgnify:CR=1 FL=1